MAQLPSSVKDSGQAQTAPSDLPASDIAVQVRSNLPDLYSMTEMRMNSSELGPMKLFTLTAV